MELTEKLAWEAVLNDLKIATEDMSHEFIWQPLHNASGGHELLDFARLEAKLNNAEGRLEIGHCIQVCEAGYFKDFLKQRRICDEDIQFLTKDLPSAMSGLQEARNFAQHQSHSSWQRKAVQGYFHQFFGIGQKGVLPELARIGRQIRAS